MKKRRKIIGTGAINSLYNYVKLMQISLTFPQHPSIIEWSDAKGCEGESSPVGTPQRVGEGGNPAQVRQSVKITPEPPG